jgi:hypothetical protein
MLFMKHNCYPRKFRGICDSSRRGGQTVGLSVMVILLFAISLSAVAGETKVRGPYYPLRNGINDPSSHAPAAAARHGSPWHTLDVVGMAYNLGTTWYDYQHNGTAAKMITVDQLGFVHTVWMKGYGPSEDTTRHVFYQVWDPATGAMIFPSDADPTGIPIDNATRAGYVCQATLPNGWTFPAYHEMYDIAGMDRGQAHATVAQDYRPHSGAFLVTTPQPYVQDGARTMQLVWPKVALGPDSVVHMIASESPNTTVFGVPQHVYYSRGHSTWDVNEDNILVGLQVDWDNVNGDSKYMLLDSVSTLAGLVVASPRSNRVALLWAHPRDPMPTDSVPQTNNDLYLKLSDDGGVHWRDDVNLTNFAWPDVDCVSGDTAVCDRDTFRVYADCAAIFDDNDNLHVGFTTRTYYELEGGLSWKSRSDVWHWSEIYGEFSNIAHGWVRFDSTSLWIDCGAWQLQVQRPSFAIDHSTGYLYCSYQVYDSAQSSDSNFPQGEAFVSVSRNCGRSWSEGTNVTQTNGGQHAPAGTSQSERDVTIADSITYANGVGYLHMEYVFDLDAGSPLFDEGTWTENPVRYQRIPIDEIPSLPIHDPFYPALHADSTGFPGRQYHFDPTEAAPCVLAADDRNQQLRPESFRLYQNYPNPFNPTTNIQFDLIRDARVTLQVLNVLGQNVATIYDHQTLSAGARAITFDGSHLASGVYVYRLEVKGHAAALKMLLLK